MARMDWIMKGCESSLRPVMYRLILLYAHTPWPSRSYFFFFFWASCLSRGIAPSSTQIQMAWLGRPIGIACHLGLIPRTYILYSYSYYMAEPLITVHCGCTLTEHTCLGEMFRVCTYLILIHTWWPQTRIVQSTAIYLFQYSRFLNLTGMEWVQNGAISTSPTRGPCHFTGLAAWAAANPLRLHCHYC